MEPLDGMALSVPDNLEGYEAARVPECRCMQGAHRLLIVDDSLMQRECLQYMLSARAKDFDIEAVAHVREVTTQTPDVVVLRVKPAIARIRGWRDDVAKVRDRFGDVPIVAFSDVEDISFAVTAMRDGLRGWILTSITTETAIAAIRLVLAGGAYVPSELFGIKPGERPDCIHPEAASGDDVGFTSREAEVLELLKQGKPNKIIAYELNITENTVKVHMRNIMRKAHATNRTQVAFLIREKQPLGLPEPRARLGRL